VTDTLELPQCLYNIEDLRSETLSEKIMEIWGSRDKIVATLTENIPKAQDKTMSNGRLFKQHIL
jgi:polysaccharide pyruvyl transferase WcaK-like protein